MLGRVCPRVGSSKHGPTAESLTNPRAKSQPPHHVSLPGPWSSAGACLACQVSPRHVLLHPKLSPPPRLGGDGPWGAGCPCAARRGSASSHCLCRWLYEGISRQKAEELLLRPGNRSGSFLIRESQTRQGCYSLSVRRGERASWDSVTHYRIQRLENGWLYISPRLTFPSLHDLVDHYSGNNLLVPSTPSPGWGGELRCALQRVWGGAVLPPRGALFHGRGEGSPRPRHARCCEEAHAQLGHD
ncbi:src-like-adapter 2 isoform 3-T4 [Chlamydotis macqueenii]